MSWPDAYPIVLTASLARRTPPVIHRNLVFTHGAAEDGTRWSRMGTTCGLELSYDTWENIDGPPWTLPIISRRASWAAIHANHADVIGRPCRRRGCA